MTFANVLELVASMRLNCPVRREKNVSRIEINSQNEKKIKSEINWRISSIKIEMVAWIQWKVAAELRIKNTRPVSEQFVENHRNFNIIWFHQTVHRNKIMYPQDGILTLNVFARFFAKLHPVFIGWYHCRI